MKPLSSMRNLPRSIGRFEFAQELPIHAIEKPYEVVGTLPPDQEPMRRNTKFEVHDVYLYDLRREFDSLSVDTHGFEFLRGPEMDGFDMTSEQGLRDYLLAALKLLKEHFHTEDVLIYNYNFRKSNVETRVEEFSGGQDEPQSTVTHVHTDGTPEGGPRRIRNQLTEEEFDKYSDGSWRSRIVTLWRPIKVVEDAPLALCDPASLGSEDLLIVARPTADFVGEISYAKFNPNQRWYWLSDQKPDELILFSSFDSEDCSKIVPHGAITEVEPRLSSRVREARESIDVRAIVMTRKP